jgi:ABC-type sugar transport system permease subunit
MGLKMKIPSSGVKRTASNKRLSYITKRALWGRLYILPWFIGVVFFFIIPFIQSLIYTFNKISISDNFSLSYVGFANYIYLFTRDPDFLTKLGDSLTSMLPQVFFIVLFSLFIAMILKDKFRGRTLARAIFFLPVIIATGVVITVLKENIMFTTNAADKTAEIAYLFQAPKFDTLLANLGIPSVVLDTLDKIINSLFDLVLKSGVQILLTLSAVNNIPTSSYEVATIEGATAWEKFWIITFPLVTPTLLVSLIYTIIDSFTDYGNEVMRMVTDKFAKGQYEYSTTIAMVYFFCILIIIGIIYKLLYKHIFYMSD